MLVGVLSDTHGELATLRGALALLCSRGAQHLLHAGDWGSVEAVELVAQCRLPFTGVLGNVDGNGSGIRRATSHVHEPPYGFTLGGREVVVVHDLGRLSLPTRHEADVVVCGHTHQAAVERPGPLIVNPGECCGRLTGRSTVALLDLDRLDASILDV